jgi:hypothetical protein
LNFLEVISKFESFFVLLFQKNIFEKLNLPEKYKVLQVLSKIKINNQLIKEIASYSINLFKKDFSNEKENIITYMIEVMSINENIEKSIFISYLLTLIYNVKSKNVVNSIIISLKNLQIDNNYSSIFINSIMNFMSKNETKYIKNRENHQNYMKFENILQLVSFNYSLFFGTNDKLNEKLSVYMIIFFNKNIKINETLFESVLLNNNRLLEFILNLYKKEESLDANIVSFLLFFLKSLKLSDLSLKYKDLIKNNIDSLKTKKLNNFNILLNLFNNLN